MANTVETVTIEKIREQLKGVKSFEDVTETQVDILLDDGICVQIGVECDFTEDDDEVCRNPKKYLNDFSVTHVNVVNEDEKVLFTLPPNEVTQLVCDAYEFFCDKEGYIYNVDNNHFEGLAWVETCRNTDQWLKSQAI